MRYKVIALILIIPLMLMFCVFSAANIATIKVPISVSNVSLFHNEHEVINLVESNEFQINAQVMPRNASNKGLIYTSERVKNKNYPNLNINEDGLVKASGYGTAKISVTTKEGAYKKSFLLEVTSTLASDLNLSLNTEDDIFVGDSFKVNYEILPNETLDKKIKFSSSDSTIVEIDSLTGECEALSSGKVTLYGVIENGLNGRIIKELNVVILPSASNSLITFDGKQNFIKKIYTSNVTSIIEVNFTNLYELGKELTLDDILLEYDKTSVDSVSIIPNTKSSGIYKYLLNINGIKTDNFVLTARIDYDGYREFSSSITLEKVIDANDITINLTNIKNYVKKNTWNQFSLNITPKDFTGYEINAYFITNTAILEKDDINNVYYYNLTTEGTETLVVEIIVNEVVIKTIYKEITALNPPSSISFSDSVKEYGIENLLTVGSEKLEDNKYIENLKEFTFTTNISKDYIELTTSDNSIAEFINGKLKIYKEGFITITATELQSKLLGINLSCELDVRCILGVEVDSYKNLVKATEENKQVVLTKDIMLGEKLIEVNEDGTTTLLKTESECAKILSEEINYIETTGEWNYYKNNKDLNYTEPPLINYIIKFTNNLYGNGFILNASNITIC